MGKLNRWYIYLINGIQSGFMVIFGDLQAIQNTSIGVNRGDFDRITRGKERGSPIVNKSFIYNNKTFNIVELFRRRLSMQRDKKLLVLSKSWEIGIQNSDPPHLLKITNIINNNNKRERDRVMEAKGPVNNIASYGTAVWMG